MGRRSRPALGTAAFAAATLASCYRDVVSSQPIDAASAACFANALAGSDLAANGWIVRDMDPAEVRLGSGTLAMQPDAGNANRLISVKTPPLAIASLTIGVVEYPPDPDMTMTVQLVDAVGNAGGFTYANDILSPGSALSPLYLGFQVEAGTVTPGFGCSPDSLSEATAFSVAPGKLALQISLQEGSNGNVAPAQFDQLVIDCTP